MLGMLGKLLNTLTCVFACECKSHFVGKVEMIYDSNNVCCHVHGFAGQTIAVCTLLVQVTGLS